MGPFSARYAGLLPVPLLRRVLIKKQRSFGWRRHVAAGTKNDSISQRCSATWAGLLGCLVLSAFFGSMLLVALNLCENVSTRCLHATLVHSLGVSDPLSFASELVNIVGSFRSSGESNQRSSTKLRIFVLGPFRRAMNLTLSSESTIQDVLHELRRRRLIPELTRLESAVIFQGKNIKSSSTLHEAGIHELSTLHLRYSVLGGSQRTPGVFSSLIQSESCLQFRTTNTRVILSFGDLFRSSTSLPIRQTRCMVGQPGNGQILV
ncbi:hypothetical protein C8F01DRAFT_691691 [Mycena amicta]|nr:hypothetical protein C8F01DRAFT_691691 [Mycena amicta]